jgi:hypothetical protein
MLKVSSFARNPRISVSRGRHVAVEPPGTGFNRITQVLRDGKAKYFGECPCMERATPAGELYLSK